MSGSKPLMSLVAAYIYLHPLRPWFASDDSGVRSHTFDPLSVYDKPTIKCDYKKI